MKTVLIICSHDGRVGRQLRFHLGKTLHLTGVDPSLEAHATVSKETSAAYDNIVIPMDLVDTFNPVVQRFVKETNGFRAVVICEALGPGPWDVHLEVFNTAIQLVARGGYVIIVVNEKYMEDLAKNAIVTRDRRWKEFLPELDRGLRNNGKFRGSWAYLKILEQNVYKHRLNVRDEWIRYRAIVFEKL